MSRHEHDEKGEIECRETRRRVEDALAGSPDYTIVVLDKKGCEMVRYDGVKGAAMLIQGRDIDRGYTATCGTIGAVAFVLSLAENMLTELVDNADPNLRDAVREIYNGYSAHATSELAFVDRNARGKDHELK